MTRCFDFEGCENGYVVYQNGQKIKPHNLVDMLNGNGQANNQMPPWLQHLFIHFIKRSAKMLITWIDGAQEANIINPKVVNRKDGDNRLKKLS